MKIISHEFFSSQVVVTAEANSKTKTFAIGSFDLTRTLSSASRAKALQEILEGNADTIASEMHASLGETAQAVARYLHPR